MAALALLGGAIWWHWRQTHPQRPHPAAPLPASIPKTQAPLEQPNPFGAALSPSKAMANAGEKSVEVCGIGKVVWDTEGELTTKSLEAKSEENLARWQTSLLKSDDPRARAVGLLIDSRFNGPPAVESLVQLTEETHDPVVYAIALNACTHHVASTLSDLQPASCGQISATGWTAIDSDNAAAWMTLASIARSANDMIQENEAFARAAKATAFDGYNWSLFGFAEPEMPRDLNPLERYELSIYMVGIEAAMSSTHLTTASRHCSSDAIHDEGTRSQCDQVADLLVTKGSTLLDLGIGTAIGARVGWPKSRVAELTEQKEAFQQAERQQSEPDKGENFFSCANAARRNLFLHEWAQLGELGAAHEIIDRSGESISDLALKYRDFIYKLQHASP